ncbi:potassium-transporting ATPase potassium-binding subunit [Kineosporia sp. NBRC 101677]|uniref:potassium-transporting ATPase subunit KdpA n=1 Tax=Kineosporia sp. NBRC 101677 TaxID=3032197 RepID=UPI0024A30B98|nr:potassium-transporting ATPase subunit KdpA [Kineosporia sp. NBRC 101677]GLY17810.1 potassium-transporting ATPase potassium-binding subunit [Kineosporia sp. NBRC 101677]
MSSTTAGVIFVVSLVVVLAAVNRPAGDYLYRVFTSTRHSRLERGLYKVIGVDPEAEQPWGVYARSVLAFSLVSLLFLYLLMRLQGRLLLSLGFDGVAPDLSWNTAVSFVANTNWQAYSGESTMGHLVQMTGLAVQNFTSAAVGIAVAVALTRGFARSRTEHLGNFWVDLVRICLRVLLPVAAAAAIVFIAGGAVQSLSAGTELQTLAGGAQTVPGGPAASQEAIKLLGTNGGGFWNVNSAHPLSNPTTWTNWLQIFLILLIPVSLPRAFGRMVGSTRQGYAILAAMSIIALASIVLLNLSNGLGGGNTVPAAAGAATEGTDTRFGVLNSATFGAATTLTSTGAVNSFHSSYTSFGGGLTMLNMMLGEIAPGGTGSGLYGMLVIAVITVFVAGLMVGRTPEYLGKKIGSREIKFASLYLLTTPALVLVGTAVAMADSTARESMLSAGSHGFSEVLYAFTSASNNNGSAFAGLSANTGFYNTALGICMLLGRLLPIIFVLALAGSLAQQRPTPESAGTLKTYQPLFVGMLVGVVLVVVALTFLPALALGPIAEGLS